MRTVCNVALVRESAYIEKSPQNYFATNTPSAPVWSQPRIEKLDGLRAFAIENLRKPVGRDKQMPREGICISLMPHSRMHIRIIVYRTGPMKY